MDLDLDKGVLPLFCADVGATTGDEDRGVGSSVTFREGGALVGIVPVL